MVKVEKNEVHIGFTGTRKKVTESQERHLRLTLRKSRATHLHHGDCIGADALVDKICLDLGILRVAHPPDDPKHRAFCAAETILPEKPYLTRNHDIVDVSITMIACPAEQEEIMRSGTWATMRYAKKTDTPCIVIYPNGEKDAY